MVSPLGQFILWLNERASAEGRIPEINDEALDLLNALRDGATREDARKFETIHVGLELRDGRPHSDTARKVQRRAVSELENLGLALVNVDEAGYTAINVRAFLTHHFFDLRRAPAGSDANCAYVDLIGALRQASERARLVACLLIAGYKTQEVGELLSKRNQKTENGSRHIHRALAEVSKILEGKYRREEPVGGPGSRRLAAFWLK